MKSLKSVFRRLAFSAVLLFLTVPCFADANDTFAELVSDTNLTLHVADSLDTWVLHSSYTGNGTVVAATDMLKDTAGNAGLFYTSQDPATAEYDIQMDVTGTSDVMGPAGRVQASPVNTAYYILWNNGAGEWRLFKRAAGTTTTLATYTGDDPNGATITVKLEIRDAAKKAYFGGTERMSSTDNAITGAGRAGLKLSGVTSDRGDNWSYTNAGAAAVVHSLTLIGVGK